MSVGEFGIHAIEGCDVFRTEIARRGHAGQQCGASPFAERVKNAVEVAAARGGIDSPQGVVGSELHDRCIGAVGEDPVETCKAAGRGVAGDTGIDNPDIETPGIEGRLELRDKSVRPGKAVTCREAVAEGKNTDFVGCCGASTHQPRDQRGATGAQMLPSAVLHV